MLSQVYGIYDATKGELTTSDLKKTEALLSVVTASQDSAAMKNKLATLDQRYLSDCGSQLTPGRITLPSLRRKLLEIGTGTKLMLR